MDHEERPDKLEVARALLERGSVFVYLDPRAEGVLVPQWFGKQPQLVLQFGLNLPVPIPDLAIDEDGVFGTLSFNRSPFGCTVPWSAVFALVGDDGMGMVWQEDLPEEIASEVEQKMKRAGQPAERGPRHGRPAPDDSLGRPEEPSPVRRLGGPQLRAIDGGAGASPPDSSKPARLESAPSEEAPSERAPSEPAARVSAAPGGAAEKRAQPTSRDETAETSETPSEGDPPSPKRRGHLRLIK